MERLFRVRIADWTRDHGALCAVREAVFVHEQNVPLALEWDAIDGECLHVLAEDLRGNPIGTGRLLPDGHIGRMAVLKAWRGRGVGSALLTMLLALAAARGLREVLLNAQTHAVEFYRKHGFAAEGEPFLDAGIPHRRMRRACATPVHGNAEDSGCAGNS
jgi:predicted GNAT family N-acyltransferase